MQLSCEFCLWWQQETPTGQPASATALDEGRCHRFPPQAGGFPPVRRTTFCGEFTPRTYASVAKMAGPAPFGPTPLPTVPVASGEPVTDEIAATIAAAVATVLTEPHRILSVQPVAQPPFGPWPLGSVLNAWAVEGRVQHFSSHNFR